MTDPLSSRALASMPHPEALWRRSIALAALDRALCAEPDYRYYRFDPGWGAGEHMASMSNGSGDDYFVGFSRAGVFLRGFDHESPMSPYNREEEALWEGLYAGCPASLQGFLDEPAFRTDEATFALWWDAAAPGWRRGVERFPEGEDPDGSVYLLELLGRGPEGYVEFAARYYERSLPLQAVRALYDHAPVTERLLAELGGESEPQAALADVLALGYGQAYPFS